MKTDFSDLSFARELLIEPAKVVSYRLNLGSAGQPPSPTDFNGQG